MLDADGLKQYILLHAKNDLVTDNMISKEHYYVCNNKCLCDFPSDIQNLLIGCFYNSLDKFKLSQLYSKLKTITISDGCFQNAREFALDSLPNLESVSIAKTCFKIGKKECDNGICRITNCPSLRQLRIGNHSFEDFKSFELSNLNSLQSIKFGEDCLQYTDFSLKSEWNEIKEMWFEWKWNDVVDLPSLEIVTFGDSSFKYCHVAVFESMWWLFIFISFLILDLPKLHTISFNFYGHALAGDDHDNRKTIINGHESFDNTLIMKSK